MYPRLNILKTRVCFLNLCPIKIFPLTNPVRTTDLSLEKLIVLNEFVLFHMLDLT